MPNTPSPHSLNSDVTKNLRHDELDALFDLDQHFRHVDTIFERVFG